MIHRFVLLLTLFCAMGLEAQEAKPDSGPDWSQTIKEVLRFTAKSEQGDIRLAVELIKPEGDSLKEIKDSKGDTIGYSFKGERLPERFWPGCTMISKFELFWDGKRLEVPRRFWGDLAGFRIEVSSLDPEKMKGEMHWKATEFLAALSQPRVILSADGGTVLIEWGRGEECDGHSTIRWIVSKSGIILRHRHTPPDEC
jgi:hypothetical protein